MFTSLHDACVLMRLQAVGFGGFPIGLIKGRRDARREHQEASAELSYTRCASFPLFSLSLVQGDANAAVDVCRERRKLIQSRYSITGAKKMSREDRAALEELTRRER